ncbi:MAG: leucine-rich repeat domain-containing protein [Gemmatimonadetes bacterium]|nr:leucine-rich repeat domain-containing protein [Gemmatimonadota bacterium]
MGHPMRLVPALNCVIIFADMLIALSLHAQGTNEGSDLVSNTSEQEVINYGICARTPQVRDEILDQINGVRDCGLVTVADLPSITTLSLNNSGITTLQADDFSGLSSLATLRLKDNSLSTLPAGVFSGLTSLTRLDLRGNPGSDFTLTLQLDRIDDADDTASGPATVVVKVSEGAPFDMTVDLSVMGGTLSSSSLTIAKGSTQSGSITVTQSGMGQATVSLNVAPALPNNYRGIQTAVGNPLVLFERAVQNRGFFLSLDLDGSEGDQAVQSLAVPPPLR